ncbi:sensor histidine kinase [Undibacterium sp. Di24W]|uniref:sensor histidine kinase n=1 Tax=Undibacterium sp. Di24W TaxID=3413033 RepID=UPI003BF43315
MNTFWTLDQPRLIRIFIGFGQLVAINTAIAVFLTLVMKVGPSFSMTWVFSMLIGTSINLTIGFMRWLIWRDKKPHRPSFLLMCAASAPIGYYLGGAAGMLIYKQKIPGFLSIMNSGNLPVIIMSVFISLFAGIFFWNQSKLAEMQAEQEKEKARTAAIEKQALQAQLQLLQAQIEPHMLFNTLANLQGLIAIDTARAQHMLEQLIRYLRASLDSSRTQKTTLKHEFELMNSYLELLAIRMGKRLSYSSDLPPELTTQEIAPMLLQPLVENAIKHGVEPKMEGGSIHVSAKMKAQTLQILVIDTGLGLPIDYDENHVSADNRSHVGNANVRERILALYGPDASLQLRDNQPSGVVAQLLLPIASPLPQLQAQS